MPHKSCALLSDILLGGSCIPQDSNIALIEATGFYCIFL
jgi:hypothetical protein